MNRTCLAANVVVVESYCPLAIVAIDAAHASAPSAALARAPIQPFTRSHRILRLERAREEVGRLCFGPRVRAGVRVHADDGRAGGQRGVEGGDVAKVGGEVGEVGVERDRLEIALVVRPRAVRRENEGEIRGPVEWLIDDLEVSREEGEPFHILLLDETFVQNERMTIEYAASSCVYVLSIPYDEAAELVAHAEAEGFSCLGTWGHGECVRLAGELQTRDLVCRVVPFCEGGDRAWQARKAEGDMKRAEDAGAGFN